MKEWLLFNRIALRSCCVSPRHKQLSASVEADLAHACLAFRNRAAVSTRKTAQAITFQTLVEARICFADLFIEDSAKRGHRLDSILTQRHLARRTSAKSENVKNHSVESEVETNLKTYSFWHFWCKAKRLLH